MKMHSLALLGRMALAAGVLAAGAAQAEQRSFTPQAGTWVVSGEVDGKPGRGLAIDVQDDTFYMQVYNYQANGDATFHTALGQLQGNTVTAPLMHYQGGRYFGSPALVAYEAGNAGNVTITFDSGLTGTVQFPGEEAVKIERFLAGDSNDAFSPQNAAIMAEGQSAKWVAMDGNSVGVIWVSKLSKKAEGGYQLQLNPLTRSVTIGGPGDTFFLNKTLTYDCQYGGSAAQGYECTRSDGQPPANLMPKLSFRYAAADVTGTVTTDTGNGKTMRLIGNLWANGFVPGSFVAGHCGKGTLQTFLPGEDTCKGSRMPANGTWIVEDELNGEPGRGISLDVQHGVAVLQIFDYLKGGASNFHMGSGAYNQSAMNIDLFRYGGGRYFGGPARSGATVQKAGAVRIDLNNHSTLVDASIQFPGEPAKKMVRMGLTSLNTPEESLLGQWHLMFRGSFGSILTTAQLDRVVDGVARNASGNVGCRFESVEKREAVCTFYTSGAAPQAMGTASFIYNGHTPASGDVIKIKDRLGNTLGL